MSCTFICICSFDMNSSNILPSCSFFVLLLFFVLFLFYFVSFFLVPGSLFFNGNSFYCMMRLMSDLYGDRFKSILTYYVHDTKRVII